MTEKKKVVGAIAGILKTEEYELAEPLLDAYFSSRTSGPGENSGMGASMPDPKTTVEILDEVGEIDDVPKHVVSAYMVAHGYRLRVVADGTPRWDIWRYITNPPDEEF